MYNAFTLFCARRRWTRIAHTRRASTQLQEWCAFVRQRRRKRYLLKVICARPSGSCTPRDSCMMMVYMYRKYCAHSECQIVIIRGTMAPSHTTSSICVAFIYGPLLLCGLMNSLFSWSRRAVCDEIFAILVSLWAGRDTIRLIGNEMHNIWYVTNRLSLRIHYTADCNDKVYKTGIYERTWGITHLVCDKKYASRLCEWMWGASFRSVTQTEQVLSAICRTCRATKTHLHIWWMWMYHTQSCLRFNAPANIKLVNNTRECLRTTLLLRNHQRRPHR